ncbi:RNA 2'-phosphotransferase [Solirubrobacter sp. CPCC 204708]|uniref:Probable RNA 2'-phosphotransferase n=1 Tax=Solirubrobacter deserti TaxID=2282478 RepID=A0ABT4RN97_9ACTN|nr:RNA 2'-phosphotransferase [Solirubrobacter deserti]MBE2317466.1 RNA 2'-phosphotransferase [Solirubrobacter deserti]MDA0140048.1 RNA 2'-phosphotransferase [Solirubrobacter deserti]
MDDKRRTKVSKYLSKHLRHDPAGLGLTLGPGGWVAVDDLLQACAKRNFALTAEELREVVGRSDKQRFAFDESGAMIRANQGHSVEVDLQLTPTAPPEELFHGTGAGSVDSILATGLERRSRHHVHLSPDEETARRVGMRHGQPVVLTVAAGAMARAGHEFFVSANGVWLVDSVPPEYVQR